jgi:hypothetical protein
MPPQEAYLNTFYVVATAVPAVSLRSCKCVSALSLLHRCGLLRRRRLVHLFDVALLDVALFDLPHEVGAMKKIIARLA